MCGLGHYGFEGRGWQVGSGRFWEEEGEASMIKGESKVELVVVGEDSVEADVMEVTLSRWCKDWADWSRE